MLSLSLQLHHDCECDIAFTQQFIEQEIDIITCILELLFIVFALNELVPDNATAKTLRQQTTHRGAITFLND